MNASEVLRARMRQWKELESLCAKIGTTLPWRRRPQDISRMTSLYRGVCADLALAEAYHLPPGTIEYLHRLVGRAHNQLYRSRGFTFSRWLALAFVHAPRHLFRDVYLYVALGAFWGLFLLAAVLAYSQPAFAERIVGRETLDQVEMMYAEPLTFDLDSRSSMAGFYVLNNASIGLRCFTLGLAFGIGGLYVTSVNAIVIGTLFGHMATLPQWDNFSTFVTAHGPFELTAIVFSAAAGMRLGFSLLLTGGRRRIDSLVGSARQTIPTASVAVVLFGLAALIEAFISPSPLPYAFKAAVAVGTSLLLMAYIFLLGLPAPIEDDHAPAHAGALDCSPSPD